ncbi:MAG: InlB B-repeat-containing protein [Clostridia bacterium]|nr:InlB B-repeat-containing protein [Clostridia bacterium]
MKLTVFNKICAFMLALAMLSCVISARITTVVWAEPDSLPEETETVEIESEGTEPAEIEPAETEPAETEPAETKPVETDSAELVCPECGGVSDNHSAICTALIKELVNYMVSSDGQTYTISISGILPDGMTVQVTLPGSNFAVDYDKLTSRMAFAYDISLIDANGNEWQPEEGDVITISIDASLVGMAEGDSVEIYHISEGVTSSLGKVTVVDGKLTVQTTGFSVFYGIQQRNVESEYIYFDLAAGNVIINGTSYSGSIFVTDAGVTSTVAVTGTHKSENKYYVFQSTASNKSQVGLVDGRYLIPTYNEMYVDGKTWGSYITNNTEVATVVSKWSTAASSVGRTATANRIEINGTKAGQYNITIDNLWSSYRTSSTSRTTGGLSFYPTVNSAHATVYLKGNSRFGNIHYSSDFDNTHIIFENCGDGTVTVASYNGSDNHYNSVIGGNDSGTASKENSKGIVINGGTIFAGAQVKDNCTAIGGGGNGHGIVTINGGIVTAVVSSSGSAIGGGIGESSQGGKATIYINGGQIYAYNFGFISTQTSGNYPIPAAAIGGGSTCLSDGTTASIYITGGSIFARSVGGAAIGGGSSTTKKGGNATIVISGSPIIDALSVEGVVYAKSGISKSVEPGISIGGGTAGAGGTANGGYADLTISGGTLKTGSIGGGACNNTSGKFGHAIVTVTGGDIQGQIIMEKGTDNCLFTMSGGTIDNSNSGDYNFIKKDGGAVYINDPNGKATINAGTIKNCSAKDGGAVYMSAGTFVLNGGTIIASKASNYGGAVYLGGGTVTLAGGTISDCSSTTGGAIYLAGGDVIISGTTITDCYAEAEVDVNALGGAICVIGGNVNMSNGVIKNCYTLRPGTGSFIDRINGLGGAVYLSGGSATVAGGVVENNAATNGGGIYVSGGNVTVLGTGEIVGNNATTGGGIYLTGGEFILNGEETYITKNTATNGGGVYLTEINPTLLSGNITNNTATENGGGIFIYNKVVELTPSGVVNFANNKAADGAGMYILGVGETLAGFSVAECSGRVVFSSNTATGNGGGVCINNGSFTIDHDNIDIIKNYAANGGGVAVLSGTFTMNAGSIGEDQKANSATNGGGVYVAGTAVITNGTVQYNTAASGGGVYVAGTATITNGIVKNNTATNGGGAYVSGGDLTLNSGGLFSENTATNGGGAYISSGNFILNGGTVSQNTAKNGNGGGGYINGGNFIMKNGTIGGGAAANANSAVNGGGVYVSNGNVTIYDGTIGNNVAEKDGGGVFVSSETAAVNVVFLSGKLISNKATAGNGGGFAVQSSSGQTITVDIGCLLDHTNMPFNYTGDYAIYAGESNEHQHKSCPYVAGNVAKLNGGGFFIDSSSSYLNFYCIKEEGNTAEGNTNCYSLDVEGGNVQIGDKIYHTNPGSRNGAPWGNVVMNSTILVNDGVVDIYGDMENPYFAQKITVDIQTNGKFSDHRRVKNGSDINYKVHYFENFQGSGKYIATQYPVVDNKCVINISGSAFERAGYKIVGWNTQADGNGYKYLVGAEVDLVTAEGVGAGEASCTTCGTDNYCLILYAIWEKKGYVVEFDSNRPVGVSCEGNMLPQPHTQGESTPLSKNAFKCEGYKFAGWARSPQATVPEFADGESVKDLTLEDSVSIVLYAVWELCYHTDSLKYKVEDNKIVEYCEACEGHVAYAYFEAANVDYDGQPHPATVRGDFGTPDWFGSTPAVVYTKTKDNTWDEADIDGVWAKWGAGSTEAPIHAGEYTASLTVGDVNIQCVYTISPIAWGTPSQPKFVTREVDNGGIKQKGIGITSPVASTSNSLPQYEYGVQHNRADGTITDLEWVSGTEFIYTEFTNTYYYISARAKADRNHTESAPSTVVTYLSDTANVIFVYGDGIQIEPTNNEGDTKFTFKANPKEKYHKLNWSVTVHLNSSDAPGTALTETADGNYVLENSSTGVTYYIKISGVAPDAEFTAKATHDQVFVTNFANEGSFSISRDSSFTVQYSLKNFMPSEYGTPLLEVAPSIPKGTKIIMIVNGTYWYCITGSDKTTIALSEFIKMGASTTEKFVYDATVDTAVSSTYQFVFDFSEAATKPAGNELATRFKAVKISSSAVDFNVEREISLQDVATFVLDVAINDEVTISYSHTPSEGYASIWNNRESAIVVTLGGSLPADLTATVSMSGQSTDYALFNGNQFIIPCGALVSGAGSINVKFNSELVNVLSNLNIDVSWIVSYSAADKAPLNGTEVGKVAFNNKTLTLSKAPAIRIKGIKAAGTETGELRLCKLDTPYSVLIDTKDIPSEWTITLYLYRKDSTVGSATEGQFLYTGFYQTVTAVALPELSLRGQEEGTFYLYAVATKGENANRVIMLEDKYFFIAEK